MINKRLRRISRFFEDEEVQGFKLTPPEPQSDRTPRGEVQNKVKDAILSAGSDGISTRELNHALKGISKQSIQNALEGLSKKNEIIKAAKGGKHRAVTIDLTPPEDGLAEADAPNS